MFGMPARCYQSWVAAHLSTPRLLQSLGFSQQDINVNLKGKKTEEAETGRESKKKKKIILFCNQRHNGDIIKKLKLRCCEKETLLLGQCNKSEQVRHGSVFLLFFFFFFHVIQYQCLSDACV